MYGKLFQLKHLNHFLQAGTFHLTVITLIIPRKNRDKYSQAHMYVDAEDLTLLSTVIGHFPSVANIQMTKTFWYFMTLND